MNRTICWMRDLAFHFDAMKSAHPDDKLLIVFDIDGTILDFRSMALSSLQAYDIEHGTRLFQNLNCKDIPGGSRDIPTLLKEFALSPMERDEIAEWCEANFWSMAECSGAHRPFHGVMDVIRWFQLQPNTAVGLFSGRSEEYRHQTLKALNRMGEEYRVSFPDALLSLSEGRAHPDGKIRGLRCFQKSGFRVIAVIDSDEETLRAISEAFPSMDMLLLHADPLCSPASPSGKEQARLFDLTELITEKQVPGPMELVWHGVDDEATLRSFLVSSVLWAEMHVRLDGKGDLIVRRNRLSDLPPMPGERLSRLEDFLYILSDTGRGVKLDLKDPGMAGRVIGMLKALCFTDDRLWITMNREEVDKGELRLMMEAFTGAIKQFPVDSLGGMMDVAPEQALAYLRELADQGIDRFSVDWKTPECRRIIVRLQQWGFAVNIYNVPDLESFLQASLLLPQSITSYFNFPKWFYTGKSSEEEEHSLWIAPVRYRQAG